MLGPGVVEGKAVWGTASVWRRRGRGAVSRIAGRGRRGRCVGSACQRGERMEVVYGLLHRWQVVVELVMAQEFVLVRVRVESIALS